MKKENRNPAKSSYYNNYNDMKINKAFSEKERNELIKKELVNLEYKFKQLVRELLITFETFNIGKYKNICYIKIRFQKNESLQNRLFFEYWNLQFEANNLFKHFKVNRFRPIRENKKGDVRLNLGFIFHNSEDILQWCNNHLAVLEQHILGGLN